MRLITQEDITRYEICARVYVCGPLTGYRIKDMLASEAPEPAVGMYGIVQPHGVKLTDYYLNCDGGAECINGKRVLFYTLLLKLREHGVLDGVTHSLDIASYQIGIWRVFSKWHARWRVTAYMLIWACRQAGAFYGMPRDLMRWFITYHLGRDVFDCFRYVCGLKRCDVPKQKSIGAPLQVLAVNYNTIRMFDGSARLGFGI